MQRRDGGSVHGEAPLRGANRHWGIQVNVDNALDEEYLLTSINRNAVLTSPPRNSRVSVRYGF